MRRLDEIEHVGDIAVISFYDPEAGEIASFEELIGAHGGLGASQTKPFLIHPADWDMDLAPLLGAVVITFAVHDRRHGPPHVPARQVGLEAHERALVALHTNMTNRGREGFVSLTSALPCLLV